MTDPDPDREESVWEPANGLQVGQWGYVVLHDRPRKLPVKPFPLGFAAEGRSDDAR